MMEIFRFGENSGPNGRNTTFNGNVAVYHDYPDGNHCSVEIMGPQSGTRARMIIDKATAGKLGAALLKWAGTGTSLLSDSFLREMGYVVRNLESPE